MWLLASTRREERAFVSIDVWRRSFWSRVVVCLCVTVVLLVCSLPLVVAHGSVLLQRLVKKNRLAIYSFFRASNFVSCAPSFVRSLIVVPPRVFSDEAGGNAPLNLKDDEAFPSL